MNIRLGTLVLNLLVVMPAGAGAVSADDFWKTWGDGRAELSGYHYTQERYGQLRKGRVVLVFVTEEHSKSEGLKIEGDSGRVPADEKYPVLKLNAMRSFQTGIYDYRLMTSVFARLDRKLEPSKISMSVQEWCGQTFHEVLVGSGKISESLHSYFGSSPERLRGGGGESEKSQTHKLPDAYLFADALPILMRELQGPWLKPGERLRLPAVPTLASLRLEHQPLRFHQLQVTKGEKLHALATKLGTIPARTWKVEDPLLGHFTYWTEDAWPHRILRWESNKGEKAEISGSARLPYWTLNKEGDEKYLKQLGF